MADTLNLDLEIDGHVRDIDDVQSAGLIESSEIQVRSKWLAETPAFQTWIKSARSRILYIQGDGEQEPISSISFLSVLLQVKLLESDDVIVLNFFCSLHTAGQSDDSEDFSGPTCLVKALLAQILGLDGVDWARGDNGYPYLSLSPHDVSRLSQGIYSTYLRAVAGIVAKLLAQHKAIFIIIDGLDWYDSTWGREVGRLLKTLLNLVDSKRAAGVLKVLLTAATHLKYIPEVCSESATIEMPEEIYEEADSFEELDDL